MEVAELIDCHVQVEKPQNRAFAQGRALASLNSVNAMRISNTLQETACLYLIYFTRYASAMFHSTLMLREEAVGSMSFMFHTLCMYRRQAMERIVGMISFFFSPYHHKGW
jgi:hypothetical protein